MLCWLGAGTTARAAEAYPMVFESNEGQTDAFVDFVARGPGYTLFLHEGGGAISLAGDAGDTQVVRFEILGHQHHWQGEGRDMLPGKAHYYLGRDPAGWRNDVSRFERVVYPEVYPGIDLVYYGAGNNLEFDFVVQPGADPDQIHFRFDGPLPPTIGDDGRLKLLLGDRELHFKAPYIYQERLGAQTEIEGAYEIDVDGTVRFEVGAYDPALPLVIDPILAYGAYLSGSGGSSSGQAIGNAILFGRPLIYLAGVTSSINFPGVNNALTGGQDIFLMAIDPSLEGLPAIQSAAYYGGSNDDFVADLKVVAQTETGIVICGHTFSDDLPLANVGLLSNELNRGGGLGASDGFVAVFSGDLGNPPKLSAYLGGTEDDRATAVDANNGRIYLTGRTESRNSFPVTPGATEMSPDASYDAFVTLFDFSVTLPTPNPPTNGFSSYFGGVDAEGSGIAIINNLAFAITGSTAGTVPAMVSGPGIPSAPLGRSDGFVARLQELTANQYGIAFCGYLGGTGDDFAHDIAFDPNTNSLLVVGETRSNTFSGNEILGSFQGGTDAFLTSISVDAQAIIFSAYFGGTGIDRALSLDYNAFLGYIGITGETNSADWGAVFDEAFLYPPIQASLNPGLADPGSTSDAFVLVLDYNEYQDPDFYRFGTYLGGSGYDIGHAVAIDSNRNVFVAGATRSLDFPVTPASLGSQLRGSSDAFFAHISPGNVIRVDANAPPGPADGETWPTAYATLQAALAVATAGDEIWVAQGDYTGPFNVPANVRLFGGFNEKMDRRSQRDIITNETILLGNPFLASATVSMLTNGRLDGFTLKDGNGGLGGALTLSNFGGIIAHCNFFNNEATGSGGAIAVNGGSPIIRNCLFVGNRSIATGGAIATSNSNYTIVNCTFFENIAGTANGHSLHFVHSSPNGRILNCIFAGVGNQIGGNLENQPLVGYSYIQGGYNGTNVSNLILNGEPGFSDPSNSDFTLLPDSQLRNRGTESAANRNNGNVVVDYLGKPRIVIAPNCTYDMGAYEMPPNPPSIFLAGPNPIQIPVGGIYSDPPGTTAQDDCGNNLSGAIEVLTGNIDNTTPGSYNVVYRVEDGAGQLSVTTRQVEVQDVEPPVLTLIGPSPLEVECGDLFDDPGATAIDDIDGDISINIIVFGLDGLDMSTPGDYVITYYVEDAAGNDTQLQRTIRVLDTTAPVLALNGAASVNVTCQSSYTELGATATDACQGDLSSVVIVGGDVVDTASPGTYTVTYNVADGAGNAAAQITREVNVTDATAPVLSLNGPNLVVVECLGVYNELGVTALDACEGDISGSVVVGGDVVDTSQVGVYTITYNVQDSSGNPATPITRTVEVNDTLAPTLNLLGPTNLSIECGAVYTEPGADAQDACEGDLSGNVVITGAVDTSTPGSYVLNYNVSDSNGNAAAQVSRTVTVQDTAGPVITLNGGDLQLACGDTFVDPGYSTVDACEGDLTGATVVTGVVDTTTPGDYTINYSASDGAGNAAAPVARTVQVVDNVAPVITLNGSATVNLTCQAAYTEAGASATDNCDGDISVNIVVGGDVVNTAVSGVYVVTYNVSDNAGNAAVQVTRTVNVTDNVAPVITLNGSATVNVACQGIYTEAGASATDNCDGDISANIVVGGDVVNTAVSGVYVVTYNVSDNAGNAAVQVTRTVNVVDNDAPVLSLNGPPLLTVECGAALNDPGASATDACDGDLTANIVVGGDTVDTSTPGVYVRSYSVEDGAGNSATVVTRTFEVADTTAPTITLFGPASFGFECNATFTDPGFTATDACDGNLTANVVVTGSVDTSTPGEYVITYALSDAAGNEAATRTRTINVVDTTPPVVTLNGATLITLSCGAAFNDPGATAQDSCDGNLTDAITVVGTVNTLEAGDYVLSYEVEDSAGIPATPVTRTVRVIGSNETTLVLNGSATLTVECGQPYNDAGARAQRGCNEDISSQIVVDNPVDNKAPGSYLITYTLDLGDEGVLIRTRTVTVADTLRPIITRLGASTVSVECNGTFVDPGVVAVDLCDGDLSENVTVSGDVVDTTTPGDYVLRYNVSDAMGIAATEVLRTVRVRDTTGPALNLNGPNPLVIACGTPFVDPGATGTDTCSAPVVISPSGSVNVNVPGTYTRTYTGRDQANNLSTITRSVVVQGPCGSVEGEGGEGEGEGEGEGLEGEGCGTDIECLIAAMEACLADCPLTGPGSEDVDGDGLSACEEACYGTSDLLIDTDGDGMPDNYEAQFYPVLDPTVDDAFADPDNDQLTNIEEYLLNSDPTNPNSPALTIYVSQQRGLDRVGNGSFAQPFASLTFALSTATTPPVRVVVESGQYAESFNLRPNTTIMAAIDADVVIIGTILGANNSKIMDLELRAPSPNEAALELRNVAMEISAVTFSGPAPRSGTGVLLSGGNVQNAVFDGCSFVDLSIGMDITGAIPTVRRSVFGDLSTTGIIVRCPGSNLSRRGLGELDNPQTGFNTFLNTIDGPAVINQCPEPLYLQQNDWSISGATEDLVKARIDGPAEVAGFLPGGSSILASALFCTLWDRDSQVRITNGGVRLEPGTIRTVTQNQAGVYAFAAISPDRYTVRVSAPGFEDGTQVVDVAAGELKSIHFALRALNQEGEGEGTEEGEEGEPDGEGEGAEEGEPDDEDSPCGCGGGNNAKAAPGVQAGNLAISMLGLAGLLLGQSFLARKRRKAMGEGESIR